MEFEPTAIPDVVLIRPRLFGDARGHFFESFEERKFAAAGITHAFRQDNQNLSARHVLRGIHYQLQQPQGKLVRVVTGAVFDVAVDLRRSSATFGKWVGAELTGENHHMLWVPPGFGHGFVVLSESAHFLYKCTDFYAPSTSTPSPGTIRIWTSIGACLPVFSPFYPRATARHTVPRREIFSVINRV